MNRCVICGHGLKEMVNIEADPINEPYYYVWVCLECIERLNKRKEEI
jgi:hypothetical protein